MNDDFAHRIFQPSRRRLIELARGLLGTPHDAEDIVQDAYLRAHAGVPPGLVSAQAWLRTVVRHLAIDQLRHQRLARDWRSRMPDDGAADGDPESVAPSAESTAARSQESAAALRLIVDTLSPLEAAAVLLREVFEADYAEIADSAGKTETACRQLVHRARRKLQGDLPRPVRGRQRDDAEPSGMLFRLCMHAIESRNPQALHALLGAPVVTASAAPVRGIEAPCAPRSHVTLAQVGGRFALVLMLDGKVLCALPVGVLSEREFELPA